jgi:hypothetical protein
MMEVSFDYRSDKMLLRFVRQYIILHTKLMFRWKGKTILVYLKTEDGYKQQAFPH